MKILVTFLFVILAGYVTAQDSPLHSAQWIGHEVFADTNVVPVFQKIFVAKKKIRSAKLMITALGIYEANINGRRVSDHYFTPGFTSYDHRLQYQEYDVTRLLRGQNNLQVSVAKGWYRGTFRGLRENNNWGTETGLLVSLVVDYQNGEREMILSDSSWQVGQGGIVFSELYDGETSDTRLPVSAFSPVKLIDHTKDILIPTIHEPVRLQERFTARDIKRLQNGDLLIDFGQNLSGWVDIKVKDTAGDSLIIHHAETLDKNGTFFTGNLRDAKATDKYILSGGEQILHPHFTFHGFRYALIKGWKGNYEPTQFTARAIYSDLKKTGEFSCSDSLLNQLQHNIEWSLNSNFLDVPTDCPQRSERLPWTGDIQIFARTAAFNRNVQLFLSKWLGDIIVDQRGDGSVPRIVPDVYGHLESLYKDGVAGWSDAATIVPWVLYEYYNDTSILRRQFSSMCKWVDYISSRTKNRLWTDEGYGDWLAPKGHETELPLIDQCYYFHSTDIVSRTAKLLGDHEAAKKYALLREKIRAAFLREYFTSDGRAVNHTQTAYVLPLQLGILPVDMRVKAAKRLSELVRENNNHLATGFLGTPGLLQALTDYGYHDLAYTVLLQQTPPSWLYPITKGSTTIWEKWTSIKEDSSFDTSSLNHYAYGAVGEWMYKNILGIQAASPGFNTIIIKPVLGGGLTWAKGSYLSAHGKISVSWKLDAERFTLDVEIPKGITATIYCPIPGTQQYSTYTVGAGKYHYQEFIKPIMIKTPGADSRTFSVPMSKPLINEPCVFPRAEKLFVLSDIEGEFSAFANLLIGNKIIDSSYQWIFGKGHVVICGDLFDRGQHVTEYLWLLYSLEEKAKAAGGYVHVILGNHDIMNLSGDLRYVQQKYFEQADSLGNDYRDWYSKNHALGRWLRTKNIIERIGDYLFLHGGISPEVNRMNLSIEEINRRARPYYDQSPRGNILFSGKNSPFWYRGYFIEPKISMQDVDATLANYNVQKIIVGHTIVDTIITAHYDNKIIAVDVDHHEEKHEALFIEDGVFYRVNNSGERILLIHHSPK